MTTNYDLSRYRFLAGLDAGFLAAGFEGLAGFEAFAALAITGFAFDGATFVPVALAASFSAGLACFFTGGLAATFAGAFLEAGFAAAFGFTAPALAATGAGGDFFTVGAGFALAAGAAGFAGGLGSIFGLGTGLGFSAFAGFASIGLAAGFAALASTAAGAGVCFSPFAEAGGLEPRLATTGSAFSSSLPFFLTSVCFSGVSAIALKLD